VQDYAGYFHRSPDQLGPEQIREYAAYMFRDRKLADSTVSQRVGALRFFYTRVLKRAWHIEETPYPKKRKRLSIILSRDEVDHLIGSALTPFHRTILLTLYGMGTVVAF
jgi:integrase/recombinase XerD